MSFDRHKNKYAILMKFYKGWKKTKQNKKSPPKKPSKHTGYLPHAKGLHPVLATHLLCHLTLLLLLSIQPERVVNPILPLCFWKWKLSCWEKLPLFFWKTKGMTIDILRLCSLKWSKGGLMERHLIAMQSVLLQLKNGNNSICVRTLSVLFS